MAKPIIFSAHSELRLSDRGASRDEVLQAIETGDLSDSKRGKKSATKTFSVDAISPVNGLLYRFKTVEAIFADEPDAITVVTILVYYHNSQ